MSVQLVLGLLPAGLAELLDKSRFVIKLVLVIRLSLLTKFPLLAKKLQSFSVRDIKLSALIIEKAWSDPKNMADVLIAVCGTRV